MNYEYRQNEQQQTYYEQEYQQAHGYEQVLYSQQQAFPSELPFNNANLVAVLCYSLGWFSGLLFFLFTRQSRFVRFHALQALMFFGSINIIDIALFNIGFIGRHHIPYLSVLAFFAFFILNFIAFIGWLVAMIQAFQGKYYQLPFVGDFVARYINRQAFLR